MQDKIDKIANLIKSASYDKSKIFNLLQDFDYPMDDYHDVKRNIADAFKKNVDKSDIDINNKDIQLMAEFLNDSLEEINRHIKNINTVLVKCDTKVVHTLQKVNG